MGSCCGKEEESGQEYEEANERTRLLADPIRRSTSYPVTSEHSEGSLKPGTSPQKNDEHQALSNILDQTVRNIIDISQLDNSMSEQHDHQDRAKKYTEKLPIYSKHFSHLLPVLTLKDVANVERLLGGHPLSTDDYDMVVQGCRACLQAVEAVAVSPRDDLLVTFAVRT